MRNELFSSGPWVGFYKYRSFPGGRHRMDLHLTFANGSIVGEGIDDVGRFLIKGRYDPTNDECYWTKSYIGAHDVFYRGFRDGKGIWGGWEIGPNWRGGFHIWPRQAGDLEQESTATASKTPVDAIATELVGRIAARAAGTLKGGVCKRDHSESAIHAPRISYQNSSKVFAVNPYLSMDRYE